MTEEEPHTMLDVLASGFVDPSRPNTLHPSLHGEDGLRLALWLRQEGVTAELVQQSLEMFVEYASKNIEEIGWRGVKELLLTAIFHHEFHRWPRLFALLQESLRRVDSPEQLSGLLLLLRHLSTLLILDAGSGPLKIEPPSTPLLPDRVTLYDRPKVWHCIYCGWRCDLAHNDYLCYNCKAVRPFAGGSATMMQCQRCSQMSLAVALFCEWCGSSFSAAQEPSAVITQEQAGEYLHCIHCGVRRSKETQTEFCPVCLNPAPGDDATFGRICSACGQMNLLLAKFCELCGDKF